jgi:microtubule-associated protein-like 1/2
MYVFFFFSKVIAKWRKQKVLWKLIVQTECSCAAYHPSATTVAVGTLDGHAIILNAETGAHIW